MPDHFRNVDAPTTAQVVSIKWEHVTTRDEIAEAPDERDEGFWPSGDPDDAGYIGEHTTAELTTAMEAAQARYTAWQNDEWEYVGTIARAHIQIPIGGGAFTTFTIDSAGLWGTESDSDPAYLETIFEDEKVALTGQLKELASFMLADEKAAPQG